MKLHTLYEGLRGGQKKVVIRNFCYYMGSGNEQQWFHDFYRDAEIDFIFVWEKLVIRSQASPEEEKQSFLLSALDC